MVMGFGDIARIHFPYKADGAFPPSRGTRVDDHVTSNTALVPVAPKPDSLCMANLELIEMLLQFQR